MFHNSLWRQTKNTLLTLLVASSTPAFCQIPVEKSEPTQKTDTVSKATAITAGESFFGDEPEIRDGIYVIAIFSALDADTDGLLSASEIEKLATDKEQLQTLREHFSTADSDEDDALSEEEFRTLPADNESEEREFALLDKDESGVLTLVEFQSSATVDQKKLLKRAFHTYDADNDSELSVEEYLLRREGLEIDATTSFRRRDENLDGTLTVEEFLYGASIPGAVKRIKGSFAAGDADTDGLLTFEEFINTREGRPDSISRFTFRDKDKNGVLDVAELVAGIPNLRVRTIFEITSVRYDTDGDGRLSLDEFRQTLEMLPFGPLVAISDANADGKLDLKEFLTDRQDVQRERARMHFTIIDANSDGVLTENEFPFQKNQATEKHPGCTDPELAFRRLDSDSNDLLSLEEFVQRKAADDDGFRMRLRMWQKTAPDVFHSLDDNEDQVLSLAEFTPEDTQRNWVVADGELLRPRQGELFNMTRFLDSDKDADGELSADEFAFRIRDKDQGSDEFLEADLDDNGVVTFEEFKYAPRAVFKPRDRFSSLDSDVSGGIELAEFPTSATRPKVFAQTFFAFDMDRNGSLDFSEFSLTPHANPIGWQITKIRDTNNDGAISLDEFVQNEAPASRRLRIVQFEKYDLDDSGHLSPDEFSFPVSWNSFPTEALFDHFDLNDDERITFAEVFPDPGDQTALRQDQFAALDINGDDFVTWDELKRNDPGTRQRPGTNRKRPSYVDQTGGTPIGWIRPEDRPMPLDADMVFEQRDEDQNQKLSLEEYAGGNRSDLSQAVFRYFDRDEDGELNFTEFEPTPLANPNAATLYSALDRDDVQGLSLDEFVAYRAGTGLDRLSQTFRRFDSDADGKLSAEEFRATPIAIPKSDVLLSSRDVNNDGKLDIEEFAVIQGKPNPRESSQFEALDLNRDNFLTLAELKLNDPADPRAPMAGRLRADSEPGGIAIEFIVISALLALGLVTLAFMLGKRAASR